MGCLRVLGGEKEMAIMAIGFSNVNSEHRSSACAACVVDCEVMGVTQELKRYPDDSSRLSGKTPERELCRVHTVAGQAPPTREMQGRRRKTGFADEPHQQLF